MIKSLIQVLIQVIVWQYRSLSASTLCRSPPTRHHMPPTDHQAEAGNQCRWWSKCQPQKPRC